MQKIAQLLAAEDGAAQLKPATEEEKGLDA